MRVILLACLLVLPLIVSADSGPRCTDAQKTACKNNYASLPNCATGAQPQFNPATCCYNCKVVVPEKRCNDADEDKCEKQIYPNLPTCPQGQEPQFNRTTCCDTCRRPPPPADARPDNSGKCSASSLSSCIASIGLCSDDQRPEFNKTQCCPSCVPPEVKCNNTAVLECKRNQPPCASGQEPVAIAGSCCRTCAPNPPTCTPACNANQVCVRPKNESLAVDARPSKCRNKRAVSLVIAVRAAVSATVRAAFQGYSCDDIAILLNDIVTRFCAQNVNADRCAKFTDLVNNLDYSVTCSNNKADGSRPISINAPEPTTPTSESGMTLMSESASLLATDDVNTFLNDALNDANSNSDYSVSSDNSSASSKTIVASGLVLVLASLATAMMIMF